MLLLLFSILIPAHSEANLRRIAIVEQCFGTVGQVNIHVVTYCVCLYIKCTWLYSFLGWKRQTWAEHICACDKSALGTFLQCLKVHLSILLVTCIFMLEYILMKCLWRRNAVLEINMFFDLYIRLIVQWMC